MDAKARHCGARDRGPIRYRKIEKVGKGKQAKEALVRLKARELLVPIHQGGGNYKYDITPLGLKVLENLAEDVLQTMAVEESTKNTICQ